MLVSFYYFLRPVMMENGGRLPSESTFYEILNCKSQRIFSISAPFAIQLWALNFWSLLSRNQVSKNLHIRFVLLLNQYLKAYKNGQSQPQE